MTLQWPLNPGRNYRLGTGKADLLGATSSGPRSSMSQLASVLALASVTCL
jgi:hypothetical protein